MKINHTKLLSKFAFNVSLRHYRVVATLDRFTREYDPHDLSHRLCLGFGSAADAARCRDHVVPLMWAAGR